MARYRILVVPPLDAINAEVAEKLQSFAVAGLPIVFAGSVPQHADGLLDSSLNTQRVQTAMGELRVFHHVYVCADATTTIVSLTKAINPNVRFHSKAISFIQKRIGRINAFFLRNESDAMQHLEAEFEVEGAPELWDPWTGKVASIVNFRRKGDWIRIELDIQPFSSALIVFDPDRDAETPVAIVQSTRKIKRIDPIGEGGWKLRATGLVPTGKTAVIHREFPQLIDWSLDSELRGLSGSGTYTTNFTVSATDAGSHFILDLGNVKDVAEVMVNGKRAATLLLRPYEADVTDFVHSGENHLDVTVTNSLFNSMILREPRPFRGGPAMNPSGLMSAGLIGPTQMKVMD
jgi:hypothetical protein